MAQQELRLEEVVVTAQRRTQSLQEVPISIETFSGAQLVDQGFREMDDLANFVPTVEIDFTIQEQDISIRGYGTVGANLSSDQAAPTFVDGIHYSRGTMIGTAFVDVDRIEVLRGPQPVFFGQNATVGAFSVITRKPTPQWEGFINTEIGNFGRLTTEGGVGGPLTDTLGIRVAGKYDQLDGFLTEVTTGDKYPQRQDAVGRVTLQWDPTSNFTATLKAEMADMNSGADGAVYCRSRSQTPDGDPVEPTGNQVDSIIPGTPAFASFQASRSQTIPLDNNCFSQKGLSEGNKIYAPIDEVTEESARAGILDIREARLLTPKAPVADAGAWNQYRSYNSYLNLTYRLDNGIELTSLTGFIDFYHDYQQDNRSSPFLTSQNYRSEDMTSWSQELRVTSPTGGMFEWMIGAYYQTEDLNIVSDSHRANIRRGRRLNYAWQDSEWMSAFASLTYNFLDDRASIDIGGRYSEVKKTGWLRGLGGTWIFDIDPTPSTPGGGCVEGPDTVCFDEDDDVIALGNGLWTHEFGTRRIGDAWDLAAPVGMTELTPTVREDARPGFIPHLDSRTDSDFNPQVVLRYRPMDNLSVYAKWAQAFKAGGYETGVSSLVVFPDAFTFEPETSEVWEIGAKGTFWDGRARYSVTGFWQEVEDLQIETTIVPEAGDVNAPTPTVNAGLQRVRGIEFNVNAALTERLTASFGGALMDGEMVEFEGAGCTPSELRNADEGPCVSEAESAEITGIDPLVDEDGAFALAGFINRSGSKAPRTPDWKFVLNVNYWQPVVGNHKVTFNSNLAYSDGFIDNVEEFDNITNYGTHANWDLSLGFGDMDDTWHVQAWMRNITEARPQYNPEFDVEPLGYIFKTMSLNEYRTYGVQFKYNYR